MNIQIFGTKKCNDTKKAERFFKERGIKYQFIDMQAKGMSKGEFNSVAQVNGGLENMINWDGKDKDLLALIKYIADEDKLEKLLENSQVIKTPVVRNGKQSTLGYQKVGVMRMKQKKKLWLIVAALLLMLSFLFSRISISTDGIGGWVLLGMGGLFFVLAILLLVVRGRK